MKQIRWYAAALSTGTYADGAFTETGPYEAAELWVFSVEAYATLLLLTLSLRCVLRCILGRFCQHLLTL